MRYLKFILIAVIQFSFLACSEEENSPVDMTGSFVYAMSPFEGSANDVITIMGRDFNSSREENRVFFGEQQAIVLEAQQNQLQVLVPEGEGILEVSVEVDGDRSKGADLEFTYLLATQDFVVSTLAGNSDAGFEDGLGNNAYFSSPEGVSIHPDGYLIITDRSNNAIRQLDFDGNVSTLLGSGNKGYKDGPIATALLNFPWKSCVDDQGNIYIADRDNHSIRKIDRQGNVSTIAGTGEAGYQDGPGNTAQFDQPLDIAVDSQGILYVADNRNHSIRKIEVDGTVSTLSGNGAQGYQNGSLSESQFRYPSGLALDKEENIIVADRLNHLIRKIDLSSSQVSTLAGAGTQGSRDGSIQDAQFNNPYGIAVGEEGEIVIADLSNHKIRMISQDEVLTIGGSIKGFLDGISITSQFNSPTDIAILDGVIYITDLGNQRIRKIVRK